MKRCPLCGSLRTEDEFIAAHCGWCDKLITDVEMS